MLHQSILAQIATADTERVLRAMRMIEDGTLAVTVTTLEADHVTAVVKSSGKVYTVFLSPSHVECSCCDHHYRGVVCKHLIGTVLTIEREAEAMQAPALAKGSENWHAQQAA